MLKEEGYYGADEDDYLAGIQNGMKHIPVDDEYLDKQASTNEKGEKIGRLAGEPENANKELQLRFLDAVSEMREYGYDFYVQSSSPNSIGFTSSAESEDDIRAVERYLASKGLSVSRDGHGFYVSLDTDRANPGYEEYVKNGADASARPMSFLANGKYQAGHLGLATGQYQTSGTSSFMDTGKPSPLAQLYEMIGNLPKPNTDIIGGLLAGYHDYSGAGGNTQNINIDVGGITIQGEGKTNADVGRVAAETIGRELQRYANFHVNNTVVAGGPTLM
jgi:hypothetical protein